jgi:hypothetical protein
MKKSVRMLLSNRKRYFSQNGEDGVLDFILRRLPDRDKWCVEFGAWDGKYLSNTYHFITKGGYNGVLIEGDSSKCSLLSINMKDYQVICINKFVDFEGEDKLDNILATTSIPRNFDLLSIDIDGNDYQVWESLSNYSPKVVIIEINIRDKPSVVRINQPGDPYVWGKSGTSIKSMTELGERKGYCLIANVSCNAIFVKEEYYNLFYDERITANDVFLFEGHSLNELTLAELRHLGWKKFTTKILKYLKRNISFGKSI